MKIFLSIISILAFIISVNSQDWDLWLTPRPINYTFGTGIVNNIDPYFIIYHV